MEQIISTEQFSARLYALEQETAALRQELNRMRQQSEQTNGSNSNLRFADQQMLTAAIDQVFAQWGIDTAPVNLHELQEEMRKAGLETNEFSRGIIEMRDE